MSSFAFVTKSYRGDYLICRDLCLSIDRHMPGTHHYLLVDQSDLELFAALESEKRTIVNCSTLLPDFRELNFAGRRFWWHPPATLVRGWIYQQLAKIAFVAQMNEPAAVHVDSDIRLIAPLPEERVIADGQARLLRNPGGGRTAQHDRWHRTAQHLLGLPQAGYSGIDYIGPGVVWAAELVRGMIARIEATTAMPWTRELARCFRFSEYLIYGTFCDEVVAHKTGKLPSGDWGFCHLSWRYDLTSEAGIDHFVESVEPCHSCVLLQSNLGLGDARHAEIMQRIEHRLEAMA